MVLIRAIGVLLLAGGVLFSVLGVFGLYRMPDVFTRMHAAAKVITMGSAMCLVGVALLSTWEIGLRAVATMFFLYLTTPIATHIVARAAHRNKEFMAPVLVDELARDMEDQER